jgi:opacity protein-like surface antigen
MRASFARVWVVAAMAAAAARAQAPVRDRFAFLVPDLARVQYAGQAGFLSVGTGYAWWENRVEASFNYGYVPAFVGGRGLHILSERNAFSWGRFAWPRGFSLDPVVVGVTFNFSLGGRYRIYIPRGESDYYWPDGVYLWFFAGPRINYPLAGKTILKSIGAQIEAGTINQYLDASLANRSVGPGDIVSLAVSVQADL